MFGKGLLNKGLGIANNELVVKGLKGIGAATILTGIVTTAAPSVAQRSGLIIPAVVGTAARWICWRHSCNSSFIPRLIVVLEQVVLERVVLHEHRTKYAYAKNIPLAIWSCK